MFSQKSKTCGSVVYRLDDSGDVEYLLIKGLNKHWGFPKGNQEPGESDKETAKREVEEETGLKVDFIDGFLEKYFYKLKLKKGIFYKTIDKEVILYLGEVKKDLPIVIQEEEVLDFKWVNFEQGLKLIDFKERIRVLKSAENFIKNTML